MSPRRRALVSLGVLAGLLGLGAAFWPYVLANLVRPLALALWAPTRVLLTIDQAVYWRLLILLGAALALRVLPVRGETYAHKYRPHADLKPPADRVAYWRAVFRLNAAATDPARTLRDALNRLVRAAGAVGGAGEPDLPDDSRLDLPEDAAAFLRGEQPGGGPRRWRKLGRPLWRRLPPHLRRRLDRETAETLTAAQQTLRALETTLESSYDNR